MAGRRREQGAISGAKLRPRHHAAQDLELVTHNEQLDVVDVQATTSPNERSQQRPERDVEEREGHVADPPQTRRQEGRDTNIGALQGSSWSPWASAGAEGDTELAWQTATTAVDAELGLHRWVRLAEVRAATHPADALAIYWRAVEDALETADRRNYAQAVRLLTHAKTAAAAAGQGDAFQAGLAALREQHRRRPTLIAMLNKAKLDPPADSR